MDLHWVNRVVSILLLLILKQWDIISVTPCLIIVTLIKLRCALYSEACCHGDVIVGERYPEGTRR